MSTADIPSLNPQTERIRVAMALDPRGLESLAPLALPTGVFNLSPSLRSVDNFRSAWTEIVTAAGEFRSRELAAARFDAEFSSAGLEELQRRMIILARKWKCRADEPTGGGEQPGGEQPGEEQTGGEQSASCDAEEHGASEILLATATAWRGSLHEREGGEMHRLHWVSVADHAQGRGLGKTAVLAALHVCAQESPTRPVYLTSQTTSARAIRMYSKVFGFRPVPTKRSLSPEEATAEARAWELLSHLTGIPFESGPAFP